MPCCAASPPQLVSCWNADQTGQAASGAGWGGAQLALCCAAPVHCRTDPVRYLSAGSAAGPLEQMAPSSSGQDRHIHGVWSGVPLQAEHVRPPAGAAGCSAAPVKRHQHQRRRSCQQRRCAGQQVAPPAPGACRSAPRRCGSSQRGPSQRRPSRAASQPDRMPAKTASCWHACGQKEWGTRLMAPLLHARSRSAGMRCTRMHHRWAHRRQPERLATQRAVASVVPLPGPLQLPPHQATAALAAVVRGAAFRDITTMQPSCAALPSQPRAHLACSKPQPLLPQGHSSQSNRPAGPASSPSTPAAVWRDGAVRSPVPLLYGSWPHAGTCLAVGRRVVSGGGIGRWRRSCCCCLLMLLHVAGRCLLGC